MKIVRLIEELRRDVAFARAQGRRVAFVPTMGYFHEGHLSLMREARSRADRDAEGQGEPGLSVASIFVNPRQFGPNEDLEGYPRDLERDADLAAKAGVDLLFCPEFHEVYPSGFGTSVSTGRAGRVLCGTDRPGHFDGAATVVLKLFNMVEPDCAIFGWKDAQQLLLLKRMVRDFDMGVEMVGVETGREPDGLAMSSRNVYLSPREREQAPALRQALLKAAEALERGKTLEDALGLLRETVETRAPLGRIAYAEAVSMDRLKPLERFAPKNTLVAAALRFGKARLIDNVRL